MCPLDSRVCLSSGSQSVSERPWPVTPVSFTGLWKDSSCEGEQAGVCPVLLAGERRGEREVELETGKVSDVTCMQTDMHSVLGYRDSGMCV